MRVRDRLEDPQLKKDVSAFIGQEAMHSKEHAAYNEYAEEHGVDLECLELRIKVLLENVSKVTTRKHQLAITCALEHFTATMAALLKREDLTIQMQSPKMYKLWMWHAIEENEHKNVAYDVYQKVYGGYFTRVLVMMLTTLMFFGVIGWFTRPATQGRPIVQLALLEAWPGHPVRPAQGLLHPPAAALPGLLPAGLPPQRPRHRETGEILEGQTGLRRLKPASASAAPPRRQARLAFLVERRTGYCTRKSLRFDYRS